MLIAFVPRPIRPQPPMKGWSAIGMVESGEGDTGPF